MMAYVLRIIMMIFNVSVLKDILDNIANMVTLSIFTLHRHILMKIFKSRDYNKRG